jgi:hypothetical protein
MSTTIDPKHTYGTDIEDDPYLASLCDLYDATRAVDRASGPRLTDIHKGRRLAAIAGLAAVTETARFAEAAIESYMLCFRQPVTFVHNGWRWSIPSQGRGLICTPAGREATRDERKAGTL